MYALTKAPRKKVELIRTMCSSMDSPKNMNNFAFQ